MPSYPTCLVLACAVSVLSAACNSGQSDVTASASDAISATPPPGCEPFVADAFGIGGGPSITHGQQPTFTAEVLTPIGAAAGRDQVRIRIDAATPRGEHAIGGASSCYENGAQCVVVAQDLDPATLVPARAFAAVRGTVEIDAQVTPEQQAGRLRHVELREVTIASTNVPWRAATLVPGGACLWLEEAVFDTRRADGCDPSAVDACGDGRTCIARNAAGTDGSCVAAGGTKRAGEPCTADDEGGSACERGHRCIDLGDGAQCTKTCDLLAASSGCAETQACGAFGLCRPLGANDPARIGEACAGEGTTCGRDGARGICFVLYDPAGNPWTEGSKCWGYERARSACPAGQDLGYASYSQGKDRSLGVCTTRL